MSIFQRNVTRRAKAVAAHRGCSCQTLAAARRLSLTDSMTPAELVQPLHSSAPFFLATAIISPRPLAGCVSPVRLDFVFMIPITSPWTAAGFLDVPNLSALGPRRSCAFRRPILQPRHNGARRWRGGYHRPVYRTADQSPRAAGAVKFSPHQCAAPRAYAGGR